MKKLKRKIKQFLYRMVSPFPLGALRKMTGNKLLIINYHSIKGIDPDPIINKNIYRTTAQFESDLQYLKTHFQFINYKNVIDFVKDGDEVPINSVFLTFDDGLRNGYTHFMPLLLKHKVNAAFFINPAFIDNKDLHYQRKKNLLLQVVSEDKIMAKKDKWISIFKESGIDEQDFKLALYQIDYKRSAILDRLFKIFDLDTQKYLKNHQIYLNTDEIESMIQNGFAFGGHSVDHPNYDELTIDEQIMQTRESIEWVRKTFKLDYSLFAFPLRDHQISKNVFSQMESFCDVSFGVRGIGKDEINFHLQRIDVESTETKIDRVIKFEYMKFILRKLIGKGKYKRTSN